MQSRGKPNSMKRAIPKQYNAEINCPDLLQWTKLSGM